MQTSTVYSQELQVNEKNEALISQAIKSTSISYSVLDA